MFLYHRATWGADEASGALGIDFIKATSALVGSGLHSGKPTKPNSKTSRHTHGAALQHRCQSRILAQEPPPPHRGAPHQKVATRPHQWIPLTRAAPPPAPTAGPRAPHGGTYPSTKLADARKSLSLATPSALSKSVKAGMMTRRGERDDEAPTAPTTDRESAQGAGGGRKSSGRRRGYTHGRRSADCLDQFSMRMTPTLVRQTEPDAFVAPIF